MWRVEYGIGSNGGYYWRLVDRSQNPPWIACDGGGGRGWKTLELAQAEVHAVRNHIQTAPEYNMGGELLALSRLLTARWANQNDMLKAVEVNADLAADSLALPNGLLTDWADQPAGGPLVYDKL